MNKSKFWKQLKDISGANNRIDYVFDHIDCAKINGRHSFIDSILADAEVEDVELPILLSILDSTKTKSIVPDIKSKKSSSGSGYPSRDAFLEKVMSRCAQEKSVGSARRPIEKHK